MTPAQERGKAIFERTRKKDGTPIPAANQCAVCHSGPHYTNQQLADVGSGKPTGLIEFLLGSQGSPE